MFINVKNSKRKASPNRQILPERMAPRLPGIAFMNDPVGVLRLLSSKELSVLDTLLIADNNSRLVSLSQDAIALRSGCSVSTVRRTLSKLKYMGLVSEIGRFLDTSLFRVSEYFHQPPNRARLYRFFKAFCFLPIMLLSVCNGSWIKDYRSETYRNEQLRVNSFIYKNIINNLFRTKVNQLSVRRTKSDAMELKSYTNMYKKSESDNKDPWNIPTKETRSVKRYQDNNRPQCVGGSVKSEFTLARERNEREDALYRQIEKSAREDNLVTAEQMWATMPDFLKWKR
jgi:hypothetical protein